MQGTTYVPSIVVFMWLCLTYICISIFIGEHVYTVYIFRWARLFLDNTRNPSLRLTNVGNSIGSTYRINCTGWNTWIAFLSIRFCSVCILVMLTIACNLNRGIIVNEPYVYDVYEENVVSSRPLIELQNGNDLWNN